MHRGMAYPYHPSYWSTTAWFWPGFVPWKMRMYIQGPQEAPWDAVLFNTWCVSEPGAPSADFSNIAYQFVYPPPVAPIYFALILDQVEGTGVKKARWRMSIGQQGNWWSQAFAFQTFPQREVKLEGFEYSVPVPPFTSVAGPSILLRPATYAEGGSPWNS